MITNWKYLIGYHYFILSGYLVTSVLESFSAIMVDLGEEPMI